MRIVLALVLINLLTACGDVAGPPRARAIVGSLAQNVCEFEVHWALFDSDSRPWSDTTHARVLLPGQSDTIWARAGNPPALRLQGYMVTLNPDSTFFAPGFYPVDVVNSLVMVNATDPYAVTFSDLWRCA